MEEIIPYIRELWRDFTVDFDKYKLSIISVDENRPTQYLQELVSSDFIVVSCFNSSMAQWLRIIREKMHIQSPWIFYLHNQATIGLWPLYELGVGKLLSQSDFFIGTCPGDQLCMELCFERANVLIHPFSKKGLENLPTQKMPSEVSDIVFIGRVSRQKNLETLIRSFSKLATLRPDLLLHLYGKEDHLGWPNMGIRPQGSYLKELKDLVDDLGLTNQVLFHGFVKREEIQKHWENRPFLFCTPSLHSDENFGMAALMALEMGGRLVLSRWGGHINYGSSLPEIVHCVDVYHDGSKLYIREEELTSALKSGLQQCDYDEETSFFSYVQALSHLNDIFVEVQGSASVNTPLNTSLRLTEFGRKLLMQRKRFRTQRGHGTQKVFADEADPLAIEFFKCYGAKE